MKRKIFLILLLLVGLAACKKAVEPENVVIEFPTSYYDNSGMLEVGQSVTVTGRVMPETADQTIVWSSSNISVATIDQNGLITALSLGECTITATSSKEGVSESVSLDIIVATPTSIEIVGDDTINLGEGFSYSVNVTPIDSFNGVNWTVSDEAIATFDGIGYLSTLATGEVTITATSIRNSEITASKTVNVVFPDPESINITGAIEVTLIQEPVYVAAVYPINAIQTVTWSSSDEEVATIDATGKLTPITTGNVVITATSTVDSLIIATLPVEIIIPEPSTVTITGDSVVELSQTLQLAASVTPSLAVQTITWTSSNTSVATVSETGLVTAISVGTATITATSIKTSVYDQKVITVPAPAPESIIISGDSTAQRGYTYTYTAVVSPENAIQTVTWSSSDVEKATINSNGVLTPLDGGAVTITATSTVLNTIQGTFEVAIELVDPEFVEIDDLYVISVFDSIPLHYEAYPSGAKDDFVWSSSDETVATINQNGIITPVSAGYVEINIEFFGFEYISDNIGLDIVTPDLIVNPTWTSYSQSQDVIYEGVTYSFGVTAFNSLNSALALAGMDDYIYLCDGSYTENVVISINNINIITSNSGVNPNYNMSDRSSGAIFTNKITIGSGASNILLSGLDFTANGQVVSGGTAVDTVMMNFCNYYDSSIPVGDNGLVYFKELGNTALADPNTEQHYNFKFYYNRFVTPTSARLINFGRIENLEIVGNYFEGNNLSYADGVRTNYLAGDSTIIVANNTFTKISQYSLFVYKENTALDIRIINNKFYDSVCYGAIDLRNYLGTDGYIEIAYNTFESITGTAIRINHETSTSLIMNVNNNIFKEIGGKYLNNTLVGNNVGFEDNFYGDVNGAPITIDPLNIVGASIYEPYYTDINDMPKYVPEGVK